MATGNVSRSHSTSEDNKKFCKGNLTAVEYGILEMISLEGDQFFDDDKEL